MRELMYPEAIREALWEEMRRDQSVFLIGETTASDELSRETAGLEEEFGRDRLRYTPVAESAIIGTALGMAIAGWRPVAQIISIDFTLVCMDQIVNQVAHYRYGKGVAVKLPVVIRTQGGHRGRSRHGVHHEQSLEALFTHIPGLKVVMPSTPYDGKGLLKSCIRGNDPVLFIDHKLSFQDKGPVPEEEYLVPLGKADVKRPGTDVTVVAWSRTVSQALKAAEALEKRGISLEVIDPRTLIPLDEDAILNSVRKTGRLLVAHEACKTGGFGGEIAAIVAEKGFRSLKAPIKRVGSLDSPIPFSPVLMERILCDEHKIVAGATEIMAYI
ncbi:MAG: alpha-ketoacid dehydrogenase subunit beta [Chloroflexi bacterium]|nr:alpha-ketoacid dehydrogenase subunit beta [Chloroflexota bacterium]